MNRAQHIENLGREPRRRRWLVPLSVFVPVFAIYLATATYERPYHIDALTNAITAWHIGMTGSPYLPEYDAATEEEQQGNIGWITASPDGPISQYPPGAALMAAPLYAVAQAPMEVEAIRGNNRPSIPPVDLPMPSLVPAAVTAALATALAAVLLSMAATSLHASPRQAIGVGLIAALATGQWSVSSNQLWQHGPATLLVAAGSFLALKNRRLLAGFAFGCAILVRPHLALIPAVLGIGLAVRARSLRPAIDVGVGAVVGLLALLAYNWRVWGEITISGGYGSPFTDNFVSSSVGWYLQNLAGAIADPSRGVLIVSPFLILLLPGMRAAWHSSDATTKLLAVGGAVYLLVQLRANRFSGGDGHFGYRYPLEAMTAAAPLLFVSFRSWVLDRPLARAMFALAVLVSAVPQAIWAVRT